MHRRRPKTTIKLPRVEMLAYPGIVLMTAALGCAAFWVSLVAFLVGRR
jgi:hypothetical protein